MGGDLSLSLSLSLVACLAVVNPAFAEDIAGSTDKNNPTPETTINANTKITGGYFNRVIVPNGKTIQYFTDTTSPTSITKLLLAGTADASSTAITKATANITKIGPQMANNKVNITIDTLANSYSTIQYIQGETDDSKITIKTLTNYGQLKKNAYKGAIKNIGNLNNAKGTIEITTLINGYNGIIGYKDKASSGFAGISNTAKITTLHNAGGENGVVYISGGEITTLNNGVWTSGVTVDTSIHKQDTSGNWTLAESTLEHKSIKGVVIIDGGKVTTLNQVYEGSKATINGGDITTLNMLKDSSNYCLNCELNLNGGKVETLNYGVGTVNFGNGAVTTLNNKGTDLSIAGAATITTLNNEGTVTISGSVSGEVKNNSNGTVIFAKNASADALGQVMGNFTNSSGKITINATGLEQDKEYQIINGTATGISDDSFDLLGTTSKKYITVKPNADFTAITIGKSQAFEDMKNELGENAGVLAEKMLTGPLDIDNTSVIADTDSTIKDGYISTPKHIISNFKSNTLNNVPLGMGAGMKFASAGTKYKDTASANLLRFDNGYVVNSAVNEPQIEFFAMPYVGELRGKGVNGTIGGVGVGVGYLSDTFAVQGHFNYAYAESSQEFSTQRDELSAYLFQGGLLGQLFFADLIEIDINANYLLGKFKLDNVWTSDNAYSSSSDFDYHQGNVGLAAGLRFGSKYSIKPFVGVQNYFERQGSYTVYGFESDKYSNYALNGVLGVEARARVGEQSFIYARLSDELNFLNSQKDLFLRDNDYVLKYENESYKNTIHAGLGAQIFATENLKFSVEGLYKYHDSGLHFFGGSLGVRFVF